MAKKMRPTCWIGMYEKTIRRVFIKIPTKTLAAITIMINPDIFWKPGTLSKDTFDLMIDKVAIIETTGNICVTTLTFAMLAPSKTRAYKLMNTIKIAGMQVR